MNGIYFLANEVVVEWIIAATESIRAKGCTLPILIIPFDDRVHGLDKIAARYGIKIWDDPSLKKLDEIGRRFYLNDPVNAKMFRRLASFWGPFDKFIFSDVDILALMNWQEIVDAFGTSGSQFWYFGLSPAEVYKPGPLWDSLREKQRGVCFNGGFFCAHRNTLTLAQLEARVPDALAVQSQFADATGEQPFFNFCLDTGEIPVESASAHIPDLYTWNWAPSIYYNRSDFYEIADREGNFQGKRFPLIHWAGYEISLSMPQRDLYLKYRLRNAPVTDRLYYSCMDLAHQVLSKSRQSLGAVRSLRKK